MGDDIAEQKERLKENLLYYFSNDPVFLPDFRYQAMEINLFQQMGLPDLIRKLEAGAKFTYKTDFLVAFAAITNEKKNRDMLKTLELPTAPKDPKKLVQWFKTLLEKFGVQVQSKRVRIGNDKVYEYSLAPSHFAPWRQTYLNLCSDCKTQSLAEVEPIQPYQKPEPDPEKDAILGYAPKTDDEIRLSYDGEINSGEHEGEHVFILEPVDDWGTWLVGSEHGEIFSIPICEVYQFHRNAPYLIRR